MNNIVKKIQCTICKGTGFVKTETVICNLSKDVSCTNLPHIINLNKAPWSLCNTCDSSGEIDTSKKK